MHCIEIFFDGGCSPNPGHKYGSYQIVFKGETLGSAQRLDLGFGTNNEAEFESLEIALKETLNLLEQGGFDPAFYSVMIQTDSTILRNRMMGRNYVTISKKKYPNQEASRRMFGYASRCLQLCTQFGAFHVYWKKRDHNLARFGH